MKRVIYPGTFDPITVGHMDIIKRATILFDEVVVAVAASSGKKPMFTHKQRVDMVSLATKSLSNVQVVGFSNLLVQLCEELDTDIVIRGLRAVSDFEYELQMGYANASLKENIETVYLMPNLEHAFISSSIVRSILPFGGRVEHLIPKEILPVIEQVV